MADKKGRVALAGRFSPGERVRLIKVDGPHVLRPPDGVQPVESKRVDEDGRVEFTKDIEVGGRYFISGYKNGQPLDVRVTGRTEDDPSVVLENAPTPQDRTRLSDGSFLDEPPEQHQDTGLPEGATWLGQHQVPEGVWQRSDTPRGAAAIISAEERERATRQYRKQEPTEPVVEETPDPGEQPARTSVPPAHTPAKKKSESKSAPAKKPAAKKTATQQAAKKEAK